MSEPFRQLHAVKTEEEGGLPVQAALEMSPPPPRGADSLRDGMLLADWYIRYQLERELERARRHERPLSIVILTPVPSLGAEPSAEALAISASAAAKAARITDLLGWLGGNRILVILPETDRDGAAAAVYRLTTEMSGKTQSIGQLRWVVTTKVNAFEYDDADHLLADVGAVVI